MANRMPLLWQSLRARHLCACSSLSLSQVAELIRWSSEGCCKSTLVFVLSLAAFHQLEFRYRLPNL